MTNFSDEDRPEIIKLSNDTIFCSNCGSKNSFPSAKEERLNDYYCSTCGKRLNDFFENENLELSNLIICSTCKKPTIQFEKYCINCCANQKQIDTTEESSSVIRIHVKKKDSEKQRLTWIFLLYLISIFTLLLVLMVTIGSRLIDKLGYVDVFTSIYLMIGGVLGVMVLTGVFGVAFFLVVRIRRKSKQRKIPSENINENQLEDLGNEKKNNKKRI